MGRQTGRGVTFGLSAVAVLILIAVASGTALAGGPVHGARAAGMGTAFIAVADDPSAILFNPAGLTQVPGTAAYLGATGVLLSSTYEDPQGRKEKTDPQVFFPPHAYLSSDLGTRNLRAGLGIDAPFGIGGRKWSQTGLTRYASTRSEIATLGINPTLAWRPWPWLSVGVGFDEMYVRSRSERMLDQSAAGWDDGKLSFEADGWGWGYNLGVLLQPSEWLRVGFSYRSRIRADLSGEMSVDNVAPALQPLFGGSRFETDAESTVRFPEVAGLGIAVRPTRALTVALDVEWGGWSSFDRMEVDLEREVPAAGFTDSSAQLDWHDAWQAKIGAEFQATEALSLRVGYAYVQTPVPERTLEPGNPDANGHNWSVGAGYRFGKLTIDAFYMLELFEDRTVDNEILAGEYESTMQLFGASVGYLF